MPKQAGRVQGGYKKGITRETCHAFAVVDGVGNHDEQFGRTGRRLGPDDG